MSSGSAASLKKIVILTASELRHDFVRMAIALSPGIEVLRAYRESIPAPPAPDPSQIKHLEARERSEQDFFGAFVRMAPDRSRPVSIPRGAINEPGVAEEIGALAPDLLVAYGCSLVREPLLSAYRGRFLNVHLGLSPYYRGGGTNFWPLVNGEPELVGATFMHLDAGVDTGEILHQIRARILAGDTPHQIGNRLIVDMAAWYAELIRSFDRLEPAGSLPPPRQPRYYRQKDFTPEAVARLHANFAEGMIERYLAERDERFRRAPLLVNPALRGSGLPWGAAG